MDQRSQYLIQVLEKIGAPLIGAIADTAAREGKTAPEAAGQDAQRMAELLARAVQCSIEIGKSVDMASMPDQGESMRLALAALASGVIAGQYKQGGRTPGENDLKRIVTALQAVLTFSENFTPDPANIERLRQMQAEGAAADPAQASVQYLQAFIPAVNAIGAFSFGLPENQAIQDVSSKITQRAGAMRAKIFPALQGDEAKLAELALVRALVSVYAACHKAEVARLANLSEDQRAGQALSLEPVWNGFEVRAAMLEAIAPAIAGQGTAKSSGGAAKAPAPPPAPPQQQQAPAAPPPPPPQQPPQDQQGGSPLGMFAKKPPEQQAPPPASPPPPSAPPAPPPPPPAAPPSENKGEGGKDEGDPMSFFKKSG